MLLKVGNGTGGDGRQCWVRAIENDPFRTHSDVLILPVDTSGLNNLGSVGGLADCGAYDLYRTSYSLREEYQALSPGETRMAHDVPKTSGGFRHVLLIGDDGFMPIGELVLRALRAANLDDSHSADGTIVEPWRRRVVMPPPRPMSRESLAIGYNDSGGKGKKFLEDFAAAIIRFFEETPASRLRIREIDVASRQDERLIHGLQQIKLFR